MANKNANKKKVIIYAGSDLSTLLTLNRLVPEMVAMDIKPIIVFPEVPTPKNKDAVNDYMTEFSFFDRRLLQDTVIPFIDNLGDEGIDLDKDHYPKEYVCYTPTQLKRLYDGVTISYEENVNNEGSVESISNDDDIVGAISIRCMQIFKQPIIDAFKEKNFFWNVHPGRLPEFKGVIPIARAMMEGETIEWTAHDVALGIDTGDIVDKTTQSTYKESVLWHYNNNANDVTTMLKGLLKDSLNGKKLRQFPQEGKGHYFTYPDRKFMRAFNKAGHSLVGQHENEINLYKDIFPMLSEKTETKFNRALSNALQNEFSGKRATAPANTNVASRVTPNRCLRMGATGVPLVALNRV